MMKRWTIATCTTITLAVIGAWLIPGSALAVAPVRVNGDYASSPPFVSNIATPNILILMDNSGSMSNRACESASCGILSSGATSTVTTFTNTTTYSGYFNPLTCSTYNTTDNRFEANGAQRATVATACSTTTWDGNLLNWATFRRFDALKRAMTGGDCTVTRASDGTCPTTGTPALKTITAQVTGVSTEMADVSYASGTGANTYVGRIPSVDRRSNPSTIYIGTDDGYFCVDDANTFDTNCTDSFSVRKYFLKVGYSTEPTGIIQQVGSKARFGLSVFNPSSTDDGMRVLVGIGSRQSIDYNLSNVESFNTNTAAMVDAVGETFPDTNTPLAESLYDTVRYIAQVNSAYYPSTYVYPIAFSGSGSSGTSFGYSGSNPIGSIGASEQTVLIGVESCPSGYITNACGRDPYFFGANHTPPWASTSQVVNCCKTFVIVLTDGEPTADQNIPSGNYPSGLRDNAYNGTNCGGSGPACSTASNTPMGTLLVEHNTNFYLDTVAYWAHVNDMRPCSGNIAVIGVTGHCLPGTQNVTVYTFFAFGNIAGRGILAQTAMLGAFEDANGDGIPQTGEWDKENNYTGAAIPDGLPDAYFESSDVEDIQDKLLATLSSIIRKSSSGAAVSVLATSSTGEGALYQAYFYPSTLEAATNKDVTWIGYAQSLWVDTFGNLREDTIVDAVQDYTQDLIVKTTLDPATSNVLVDKFRDVDGNGLADDTNSDGVITHADCYICDKALADIKPIWEAGKQLALKDASTRTILTWVDSDHDGVVDSGEQIAFTTGNSATLSPYLRAAVSPSVYTADAIINFIRGCDQAVCTEQANLRDRRLQVPPSATVNLANLKVWKLGDVVDAPPTVVAAPRDRYDIIEGDSSYTDFFKKYRTRRQVTYVGANDGMLHAFNGGFYQRGDDSSTTTVVEHGRFTRTPTDNSTGPLLGDELWGFIPYGLLPHLQWLTRSDYQHVYYVDMPPVVKDVRIFTPDTDHPNGWGTVLIGGFRLGGSCGACPAGQGPKMTVTISGTDYDFFSAYFVLDITNPEVAPKLLWSFSDSTLGFTTSVPTVVRVTPLTEFHADNALAKWYMVAGSGPTGYDGRATQYAKVFVVDMATGTLARSIPVGPTSGTTYSFVGDMTGFDRNQDYRTDVVYFGTAINDGTSLWKGKLYRLTTGDIKAKFGGETTPATWGATGAFVPTEMLDTLGVSSTTTMGPILAAPNISIDDAAKAWVFVGSGRYFGASDKTDTSTQYFVGLKDSVLNGGCVQSSVTTCHENDLVDVTNAKICVVGFGNCGAASGTDQVQGVTGATSMAGLISLVGTKEGWVIKLLPASGPGVGERVLNAATVFGGIVFFSSFSPTIDVCASSGTSNLYALFYKTGGPYSEPVIGSTAGTGGIVNVNKSTSLGVGVAFGAVPYIGSGADGTSPYKVYINTSSSAMDGRDVNLAIDPRSHYLSWINM